MKLQLSHDKRYMFLPIYKEGEGKGEEDHQKMELLIWNTHGNIKIQKMMMESIYNQIGSLPSVKQIGKLVQITIGGYSKLLMLKFKQTEEGESTDNMHYLIFNFTTGEKELQLDSRALSDLIKRRSIDGEHTARVQNKAICFVDLLIKDDHKYYPKKCQKQSRDQNHSHSNYGDLEGSYSSDGNSEKRDDILGANADLGQVGAFTTPREEGSKKAIFEGGEASYPPDIPLKLAFFYAHDQIIKFNKW